MEKKQKEKKPPKYGFSLSEEECFSDEFDTIEELIEFAQDAHDNPDGNYWDEDWDDDEFPHVIYVGTMHNITPMDFALSLDDLSDWMTENAYANGYTDEYGEITFRQRKEAEETYKAFIEKYVDMPYTCKCDWSVGVYDLQEHKWIKRFENNGENT